VSDKRRYAYDPTVDGLKMLGEWSPARQLTPDRLVTTSVELTARPAQTWIDEALLQRAIEQSSHDSGDISYATEFRLDHRESNATQKCRISIASSDYCETRAVERLRIEQPEALRRCDEAILEDPKKYLRTPVPSSLAINVVVVNEANELLCVRRSGAVDNGVGLWTIGVFETMKRADLNRPGSREDFFTLGVRALSEELGASHDTDYGRLLVSWFGLYIPLLRGHAVAVTRLRGSKSHIEGLARESDSSYEHDGLDWLQLSRKSVRQFLDAPRTPNPGEVGQTIAIDGRRWIEQAALSITEAWRFRACLDDG